MTYRNLAPGLLIILATLTVALPASAGTLFFDDFDDGFAGWATSGNVQSDNSPAIGASSARMAGANVETCDSVTAP